MTAGDIGVAISVDVSGEGYTIPGGSVATMILAPGDFTQSSIPPTNALALTPVSISSDGTTGTYLTDGTDVDTGGKWTAWLRVLPPGGQVFTSNPISFYVNPAPVIGA